MPSGKFKFVLKLQPQVHFGRTGSLFMAILFLVLIGRSAVMGGDCSPGDRQGPQTRFQGNGTNEAFASKGDPTEESTDGNRIVEVEGNVANDDNPAPNVDGRIEVAKLAKTESPDKGKSLGNEEQYIARKDSSIDDDAGEGDGVPAPINLQSLTSRKSLPSTLNMIISFASISLVPAILLMTTCFIRIVVVLGILRQSMGLQQLPPNQVTTALALMMTFLVMSPTWKQVKEEAIDPYSAEGSTMTWNEAWRKGVTPLKKFMWSQVHAAENEEDFWLFYDYLPEDEREKDPQSFADIPLKVMLPAFMISELKVAFLIGAQIILPFLIIDIIVASFSNTVGLMMLPPTVVSLPIKLALFVLVDGWRLVAGVLLTSFAPVT